MGKDKNTKSYFMRIYTLRDQSIKSIKVESWRTLKDEMKVLGMKETDISKCWLDSDVAMGYRQHFGKTPR